MPTFGFSKSLSVMRGMKVFLNLQTGATRGEVPDPWHQLPSDVMRKKDRQVYRLRKQVKTQREEIYQLTNALRRANGRMGDVRRDDTKGTLPDFVVIGAMRCGTTRFYNLITRHPHIEPAVSKELHFFDQQERFDRGIGWYMNCFPPPRRKDGRWTITGEATPMYLFHPEAPERMARTVPDAKLIVLLRNPVDRAYSHYHKAVRMGHKRPSFGETVAEELAVLGDGRERPSDRESGYDAVRRTGYDQLVRGIYVDQLARWREFFDEEQMLILKSEDFYEQQAESLKEVEDFLGLPHREIEIPARNTSGQTTYEPMPPETRRRLETFFGPHNQRLYDFLGRDFGW